MVEFSSETFWSWTFVGRLFFFSRLFFRAVLGPQQNWAESTVPTAELSRKSCSPLPQTLTTSIPHKSDTFLTTSEPTLTHLYYPMYIAYTRIHFWCWEVFDYWVNLFTCYRFVHIFCFESVLVIFLFLGIYPFHLCYLICWHKIVS